MLEAGTLDIGLVQGEVAHEAFAGLIRAIHRGEAALGARLSQARETTAANTVRAAPGVKLLHSGVARYLREIGLLEAPPGPRG